MYRYLETEICIILTHAKAMLTVLLLPSHDCIAIENTVLSSMVHPWCLSAKPGALLFFIGFSIFNLLGSISKLTKLEIHKG